MNGFYDLFLSYASEDLAYVQELREHLINRQYRVWFDRNNIFWGDNLIQTIESGLENSYYGIVVLSPHYLAPDKIWTHRELEYMRNNNRNILIILHRITLPEIQRIRIDLHTVIENQLLCFNSNDFEYILRQFRFRIRDVIIEQREIFAPLRNNLVEREWKEADKVTYNLIKREGLLNFFHEDLIILNRLWLIYSSGRFGFSIQKEMYHRFFDPRRQNYLEAYENFGDHVRWREARKWIKETPGDANIPNGHLPFKVYLKGLERESWFGRLYDESSETIQFVYQIVVVSIIGFVWALISIYLVMVSVMDVILPFLRFLLFPLPFLILYFIYNNNQRKRTRQISEFLLGNNIPSIRQNSSLSE